MEEYINNINLEKVVVADKPVYNSLERSEMAQEIISRKPGFAEKWAILIFLGIVLLLLAATWFIRYPDYIEARAVLTAANAPKEVVVRQEGRLIKLFIHNNDKVKKGEIFAWMESTADHVEVLTLSRQLDSSIGLLNAGQGVKVSTLFNSRYNNLGEIQGQYQTFITALQLFNDYAVNGFYSRKKGLLKTDVRYLNNTNKTIQRQKELTEQDVKLAEETYLMNKSLSEEKILSNEEFRQVESKFLNRQLAIPQLEAALLSNETQERDKLKEIDQLDHDITQQELIFRQALQSFKSSVDDWKKRYVLEAPIDGNVSFIIHLQEYQFLPVGTLIGYISPDDVRFYADAYLRQNNLGKLDTGLKVQLRFEAYPFQEAGFVEGTLGYISNIASDSGFLASIKLTNGLITNNHRSITYRSGLKSQAIIITKEMRLLERLWYNFNRINNK